MPDDVVLERTLAFDPASLSAREARRFVRAMCEEAGHAEWADAAELAVSEVVTNVVLHAHTEFRLTVRTAADHVRVEVLDHNPALPRQRGYDDEATTGRGMALVDAVTDAHGVTPLGGDGKVVWFCVGGRGEAHDGDDPLAGWGDAGWGDVPPPVEEPTSVHVQLVGMPVTLWHAAAQHHAALLRELALHRSAHPDGGITEADLADADAARTTLDAALDALVARGHLRGSAEAPVAVDLDVPVPPGAGDSFARLQDVLDVAERLAARDVLLATPALPEVMALRDWACEQVIVQLHGGRPSRWPGVREPQSEQDGDPRVDAGWSAREVDEAEVGVVAADDANRIVAVSRPLAAELGYAPAELVGRRVITLVPQRFREAHVAGFTRHASTGETRLLGSDVELPVLRRDGSEVVSDVRIEERGTPGGRRVYLAWVSPRG